MPFSQLCAENRAERNMLLTVGQIAAVIQRGNGEEALSLRETFGKKRGVKLESQSGTEPGSITF